MTARMLARTCAAEWVRLWTVRSTWWLAAAAALAMVVIGVLSSTGAEPEPGDPAWLAAAYGTIPAQIALLAVALGAVTSDYTTGGILPTLQWTPRRAVVFVARSLVATGAATGLGLLLALVGSATAYVAGPPALDLPAGEGVEILSRVVLVIATGSALAVGLGFLMRNTAAGLVSVVLLLLVLPGFVPQLGHDWAVALADALPGTNALYLLVGEPDDRGITGPTAVLVLLAWAAGALALGWLRLERDDAGR
jgi:ABC-2 type transport system permease protein